MAVLFVGLSFEGVGGSSTNASTSTSTSKKSSNTPTASSENSTPTTPGRIRDERGSTPPDPVCPSSASTPAGLAPTGAVSNATVVAAPLLVPAGDGSTDGSASKGADLAAAAAAACGVRQMEAGGSEGGVTGAASPMGGQKAARAAEAGGKAGEPSVVSLELLQGSFSLLQSIVASHGGVIKELSVDDKGTVRSQIEAFAFRVQTLGG